MQYIARVNKDSILFQRVTSANIIVNADIQNASEESKRNHSDWASSGDLLSATFDSNRVLDIAYCFYERSIGLDVGGISSSGIINDFKVNEYLKKDIALMNRVVKKVTKALEAVGASPHPANTKEYLQALMTVMNVQFVTIVDTNPDFRLSIPNYNLAAASEKIIALLDAHGIRTN